MKEKSPTLKPKMRMTNKTLLIARLCILLFLIPSLHSLANNHSGISGLGTQTNNKAKEGIQNLLTERTTLSNVNQQGKTITGKISDKRGNTLPGVTIIVKGTTNGTISDSDGNYSISNVPDDAVLVFSFVGMKNQEFNVAGKTSINVTLEEETIGLDEVVAVGYGTKSRASLTGSVGVVKSDEIAEVPVGNVTTGLSGKVAGLEVVNRQGRPGNDQSDVSIRGFGAPLVLVDGIEQDFGNLDPNTIESITILKDASASIYGARAGNGVILVTTKRGTVGKPIFNYNMAYTLSTPTRLVKFVDAAEYATLKNEANISDGLSALYSDEEIEKYRNGSDPAYPNTDWWGATFKTWAPMQDHNLNVRGGNESIRYFASLGYKDQGSILQSDDLTFKRYDTRSNVDVKFSDAFSATFDLSYRVEQGTQPGFNTGGQGGSPFPSVMEAIQRAKPIVALSFPDPTKIPFAGYEGLANPVALSQKDIVGYVNDNFQNFDGTISLKYDLNKFIKGLTAEGSYAYREFDREVKRWTTGFTYYSYDYEADVYTPQVNYNDGKNTLRTDFSRTNYWKSNLRLDYQNTFAGKHNVSGLLLYELISTSSHNYWLYREGFISKDIDQFFAGSDVNKDNGGSASEDGRASVVGRFNYNYSNKYLVDFLFRYDASARFSPTNRWGFFPGISLGWRLNEEDFLKDSKTINNLKLRASYGEAGDEGNVRFNYLTGYNFSGNYAFGLNEVLGKGIASKGLANPDAVWAKTKTYNMGLDGAMWNSLLSFELDVFYREKTGILATRSQSVPSTFGASLPEENLNSFNDRGFELTLGHRKQIGDLTYFVNANLSWSRSKWVHFDEPVFDTPEEAFRYKQSGNWRNVTWGYTADGLFSSQEEIDGWADITNGANNNVIKPGDIRYLDLNNDGVINWLDERIIGKSDDPTIFYGLNTGISYKHIDFTMLWQGAAGFSKFYGGGFRSPFRIEQVPFDFWMDRWTEENNDPNNSLPRIRNGAASSHPNTDRQSTFWMVSNAYFVRLKEARISYQFPKFLLQKLGNLNDVNVFLAGTNLALITNVKHLDPEASNQNFEYYPQQKTFSLGVNVKF